MRAIDCPCGHHFQADADAARHPSDHLWNHGVRPLLGGPALPPNPQRRRDAFKIATVWLLIVGALLAAGAATAALVLGGMLVAACALVTTNLPALRDVRGGSSAGEPSAGLSR